MRTLEEIKADSRIKIKKQDIDGLSGSINVNGIACSLIFSWYGGWEHCSIMSYDKKIMFFWNDMCKLKNMFWSEEEAVV